jgi:anhydro-N-acetylmuramic acid kinase
MNLYIGLMSGTSMDAIDAVLVELPEKKIPILHAQTTQPLSLELKSRLMNLTKPGFNEIDLMGELDVIFAQASVTCCLNLLKEANITPDQVQAIGSHGQAIRHRPNQQYPFTLQIGDPNIIAEQTGITTVCDFRRRDIAKGGQGAPLTPAFHQAMFRSPDHDRIVLNIGGIANITILPCDLKQNIQGFDTGPGNTLLDAWVNKHLQTRYDKFGAFGAKGQSHLALLSSLLSDPYFKQAPPKSTGLEYFHLNWLNHHLEKTLTTDLKPEDIQATLQDLTARSISEAIKKYAPPQGEILVCGGGIHNVQLMHLLDQYLPSYRITSTQEFGIHPNLVEATAFAWFAKCTINQESCHLPSVTGATGPTILGGIYPRNPFNMSLNQQQADEKNARKQDV